MSDAPYSLGSPPPGFLLAEDQDVAAALALLPAPNNPMAVARELVEAAEKAGMKLAWWRGDFYEWAGTHWQIWPEEAVNRWLYASTEHARYMSKGQMLEWAPSQRRISDLRHALGQGVLQRDSNLEADDGTGTVALINGVLNLSTMILADHSPDWFNLHCSPFPYDPDATCPLWLKFLGEALEDDPERISLLQEIFGYLLCGGTALQKIFSLFGPKRCGKGTVLRIIAALIGKQHIAAPSTLDSIAGTFGMAQFIGRSVAMIGDVQWVGSRMAEVVGILLNISGEDSQTVHRKNRTDWCGQLPTRFVIAGNDRPKFNNTSGALAGRMEHLQFRTSFYGREDPGLTGKLTAELSGIFNWAVVGWRRLESNGGRFTKTELGVEAAAEVERSASPVHAFIKDMCVEEGHVDLDHLYREYERWQKMERLDVSIGLPAFSQKLQSVLPMVKVERRGSSRVGRTRIVFGLRLLYDGESPPPPMIADPADPADPTPHVDHASSISAGQGHFGPGGPGGPDLYTEKHREDKNSYERMRFNAVGNEMGNLPGPPGPRSSTPALTCTNGGPGAIGQVGSAPGPAPPARSGFDPELWADFDHLEPPNVDAA